MNSDPFHVRSQWTEKREKGQPPEPEFPGRRSFFMVLLGVGGAFVAALLSIPLIRYTIYPLLANTTKTSWSSLGPLDSFSAMTQPMRKTVKILQVDGWRESVSEKPVYVTKGTRPGAQNGIEVLSSVCPHLGCEVPWNENRGQFVCPCHNSVFAADGSYVSGPARRGMDTLPIESQNGDLKVRFEYFRELVPDKEVMG